MSGPFYTRVTYWKIPGKVGSTVRRVRVSTFKWRCSRGLCLGAPKSQAQCRGGLGMLAVRFEDVVEIDRIFSRDVGSPCTHRDHSLTDFHLVLSQKSSTLVPNHHQLQHFQCTMFTFHFSFFKHMHMYTRRFKNLSLFAYTWI